ncbi:MAG: hypothetical protein P8O97_03365 [Gammaproteobacteria bacterium]|nr:hypothetical protein [Gammaproteobacteria bacterium]
MNRGIHVASKILLTVLVACSLSLISATQAGEFSVSPMLIHVDEKSGRKPEFSFTIKAKSAGAVIFEIYKLKQLHSGHMEFLPLEDGDEGLVKWITLETDGANLKKGEKRIIRGQLNIPSRTKGSHLAAIMVKEESRVSTDSLAITVRYAIVIDLKLATQRGRLTGSLTNLKIEQREEGNYVTADFSNLSKLPGELESRVDIRNDNGRLIERVNLVTESAQQRAMNKSRVFPETTVGIIGLINSPIRSGTLHLSANNRLGKKLLQRKKVEIVFNNKASGLAAEYKLPKVIISQTDQNLSKNKFTVHNPYNKTIKLRFPKSTRNKSETYSFRPRQITLNPGGDHEIELSQHWNDGEISPKVFLIDLALDSKWHEVELHTVFKND